MSPWSQGTRVTGNSWICQVPGCGASFRRNGSEGLTLYPSHDTRPLRLSCWTCLESFLHHETPHGSELETQSLHSRESVEGKFSEGPHR